MKKRTAILLAIGAALLIGGGVLMSTIDDEWLDLNRLLQRSPRERQLDYLKGHEEEIKDFIKAQNPKVESVQIYWDRTSWDKIGNGTPQGGGDIVEVYGGFNHTEKSNWSVSIEIENERVLMETIEVGNPLRIGGEAFD